MGQVLAVPKSASWSRIITVTLITTVAMVLATRIVIPWTPVPLTLQVFVVVLSGMLLGMMGVTSQALFFMLVSSGAIVSASGAPTALCGPTGGYLLAFPFAMLITGYISIHCKSAILMFLSSLAGLAVIYLCGSIWLEFFVHGFGRAIMLGVVPFLAADVIKCVVATAIAYKGRGRVIRWIEGGSRG